MERSPLACAAAYRALNRARTRTRPLGTPRCRKRRSSHRSSLDHSRRRRYKYSPRVRRGTTSGLCSSCRTACSICSTRPRRPRSKRVGTPKRRWLRDSRVDDYRKSRRFRSLTARVPAGDDSSTQDGCLRARLSRVLRRGCRGAGTHRLPPRREPFHAARVRSRRRQGTFCGQRSQR